MLFSVCGEFVLLLELFFVGCVVMGFLVFVGLVEVVVFF